MFNIAFWDYFSSVTLYFNFPCVSTVKINYVNLFIYIIGIVEAVFSFDDRQMVKKKNISKDQRSAVYDYLWQSSARKVILPYVTIEKCAEMATRSWLSKSTLHRARKGGHIVRHSNSVRPELTPANNI